MINIHSAEIVTLNTHIYLYVYIYKIATFKRILFKHFNCSKYKNQIDPLKHLPIVFRKYIYQITL